MNEDQDRNEQAPRGRDGDAARSGDGHGAQARQDLRKTLVGDEKIAGEQDKE